jgi:hypothetical protein
MISCLVLKQVYTKAQKFGKYPKVGGIPLIEVEILFVFF